MEQAGGGKLRALRSRVAATAFAAALLFGACFGIAAAKQEPAGPPPDAPSVDALLEKYIAASGGREALRRHRSRVLRGTFAVPIAGLEGPIAVYTRRPDRVLVEIDLAGFGMIRQGYDGTTAWEDGPQGFRIREGDELAEVRRDALFDRDLRLRELFPTMRVVARENVLGRDTWVVEAVPAEGKPERFYFDAEDGRLLRQDATRDGAEGPQPTSIFFEEFFTAEGLLLPRRIRQDTPMFSVVMTFRQVEHDVEIPDEKFAPPPR
jgi:hypothetical protein